MTVRFSPGEKLCGLSVPELRRSCKILRYDLTLEEAARARFSRLGSEAEAIMMMAEHAAVLLTLGLIEEADTSNGISRFQMTDDGMQFASSVSYNQISLAQADRMVAALIASVARHQADDRRVEEIEEIWAYGSYARREAAVTDVDLAFVMTSRKFADRATTKAHTSATWHALFPGSYEPLFPKWPITRKLLFPERRPPHLSIATSERFLIQSACPCSLLYSRDTGAIDEPELLDHHPQAGERDPEIVPMENRLTADSIRARCRDHTATLQRILRTQVPSHVQGRHK